MADSATMDGSENEVTFEASREPLLFLIQQMQDQLAKDFIQCFGYTLAICQGLV